MPARHLPQNRAITYRTSRSVYYPDTCQPLLKAAEKKELELHAVARGNYPGRRLPQHALPGLRNAGCWRAFTPQNWGLAPHRNEGIELSFLAGGTLPVALGQKRFHLCHDELLITRPWQEHQIGNPTIGPSHLVWIILDVGVRHPHQRWIWPDWVILGRQDLADLTRFLRHNERPAWPCSPRIREAYGFIESALMKPHGESNETSIALGINHLLYRLVELFRQRVVPMRSSLVRAERSVEMVLADMARRPEEPWTISSIAQSCGFGTTKTIRIFRNLTSTTPMVHLARLRIERAKDLLLRNPETPITEIAFSCGFSSSQYFTNVFRKQIGCSPREFRRNPAPASRNQTDVTRAIPAIIPHRRQGRPML